MVRIPERGRRGNLVLARHEGERLLITGGITVQIVRSRHGKTWLQVQAPGDVDVWREEIAPPAFVERHRSAA